MSIALSQDGESSSIQLGGAIDIAAAEQLKATLLEALESGRGVSVSIDAVSALDVTAFQLFWSARREATQKGLKFKLTPAWSERIRNSLECMGLDGLPVG